MIRAIIIDDEKKNIMHMRGLLAKHAAQVTIVGEAFNAEQGLSLIADTHPELIFLDIQMPGKSGFDLLSEIGEHDFDVIFVTGYDQYGVQAIKFSALDYLMKPVKPDEIAQALLKATSRHQKRQTQEQIMNLFSLLNSPQQEHRIVLPLFKEMRLVSPDEIIRCESVNNYTNFYLQSGEKLMVSKGIYEFDEMLRDYHFIRCHQSHLVNRKFIRSLMKDDNIFELLLTDGTRIPVSRLKKEKIKEELIVRK